MAPQIELSRCPYCGARGVKQYAPIILDGVPVDRPYCGRCGRNYPPSLQESATTETVDAVPDRGGA